MTDIHSHILHRIDDGPAEISDSIELIKGMVNTGITRICATSHYYFAKESPEAFVAKRTRRIDELKKRLTEENVDVEIFSAGEVLIDKLILNRESISELCYNGGKYILLEMPMREFDYDSCMSIVDRVMSYFNVVPVIAHIERYPFFVKNEKKIKYLKDMGCLIQLDANCFFDGFISKRFCCKLIKKGLADVIASDCHNLTNRYPNLHFAYDFVGKRFDNDVVGFFKRNADKIVGI